MSRARSLALGVAVLLGAAVPVRGQAAAGESRSGGAGSDGWRLAGGALVAFGAHELGHVAFTVVFDAEPGVKRITAAGLPFFAITHAKPLSRRREYAVAASGLWVQHAFDEAILSHRPGLRRLHAPVRKGVLAFDAVASALYVGAALARKGPAERDTRTMAVTLALDERWVGLLLAAPLALDAVRYLDADARWAVWSSRAVKAGLVLLVVR